VNIALALVVVVAAASDGPVVTGAAGDTPVFTRDEPNLAAGRRALLADDIDTAIERFRRASATTDSERAVVEYDVGQALTMRALAEVKARQQQAAPAQAGQPGAEPPAPPTPPNVDDAIAAFDRAATLARDQRLASEARLAAGNAALVGGKLEDAIDQLRKALVADPHNERARRNLQRALTMKQQQPPPPPQEGGDQNEDGDQKDQQQGDQKDQQQGDQKDQQQGDQNDQQQGDQKDQQQDGRKKDQQPGDQKDQQQGDKDDKGDEKTPQPQDGDTKDQAKDGEQPSPKPAPKKPTSKEEARRLLQGLRSRERPLSPLEMRGTDERPAAPAGKDW
jgi:tetratricopeptide (TPR) repeat protein